ncbi:hypothetical protein LCGC14_2613140, partial [marine sediment metagenome]
VIAVMPLVATLFLKDGGPKYLGDARANRGVAAIDKAAGAISEAVAKLQKTDYESFSNYLATGRFHPIARRTVLL